MIVNDSNLKFILHTDLITMTLLAVLYRWTNKHCYHSKTLCTRLLTTGRQTWCEHCSRTAQTPMPVVTCCLIQTCPGILRLRHPAQVNDVMLSQHRFNARSTRKPDLIYMIFIIMIQVVIAFCCTYADCSYFFVTPRTMPRPPDLQF